MPRQRSKKLSASRKTVPESAPAIHHEDEQSGSDNEDLEILEKDAQEEELDKLVLGDGSAFMAQIGGGMDMDSEDGSDVAEGLEDENDGEGGLEGVDDADLFFLDSGPSAVDPIALIAGSDDDHEGGAPAWEDSDDERLAVSLAGNSRLRKLRVNEDEDVVSGREYTKRLRRQFERLNPVPEWALPSARPTKRRRRSSAASDSSISSNEMDVDDSDLSTLPLARLLQDAGSLTRTPVSSAKRPKLRPEVLDIQRSRDIPSQPSSISSLSFHPEYPVLLSSGPASTLYLHHIAPNAHPTPHPLLTSVHVRHTPIHTSSFLYPQGDKIFFAGRRKYFHVWDLPSGNIQK
ncbi:putative U3 small nucleolar RNA-associated protein [Lachnellula subtilissima]|uniref:Putative U3 small nucleolar RNA-associated protein n=1 Tax=Lachnellula subtilissima TaxID=602034 RepID=A0A8H8RU22_9HELO|nr:putative U3 small nucleolar RNA-associated protein [Lachnellula subtilissima]